MQVLQLGKRQLNLCTPQWPSSIFFVMLGVFGAVIFSVSTDHHGLGTTKATRLPGDERPALVPVIFVPGLGGSSIEVKTENFRSSKEAGCKENEEWHVAWATLWNLRPWNLRCLAEKLSLYFDEDTGRSRDPDGLTSRVRQSLESIENLDSGWLSYLMGDFGKQFGPIVQELTKRGYSKYSNIFAVPFDFRYAPSNNQLYYDNLKRMVEVAHQTNAGAKVSVVSHSLGGLYSLKFLNQMTQAWKDRHIDSLIAFSTPWCGSLNAIEALVSGYDLKTGLMDLTTARRAQRTFESNYHLIPTPSCHPPRHNIVETPARNYTASHRDVDALLRRSGANTAIYEAVRRRDHDDIEHRSPGVDVFCIQGSGRPTPSTIRFTADDDFPDRPDEARTEPGDGTVSTRSMSVCRGWSDTRRVTLIENVDHVRILLAPEALEEVVRILFRNAAHPPPPK